MILPNNSDVGQLEGPEPLEKTKTAPITPETFFQALSVGFAGGVQGLVFSGAGGAPNDHMWNSRGVDYGQWAAAKVKGRKPAYMAMASFEPDLVHRYKGRTVENVLAVQGFWVDIEGSAEKFNKPGGENGGYPNVWAVFDAIRAFGEAVPLVPNFLVLTGSGGAHLHFVLVESLTVAEWRPRANALVALAALHDFKIDAQCTTDAARIMRAPGSLHQKTGIEVVAYKWRAEPYQIGEWDNLIGFVPGVTLVPESLKPRNGAGSSINGDVLNAHAKFSYLQAAKQCSAMKEAAQRSGQSTAYPVWILAAKTADLSKEGREFAHEISCGHVDYDPGATDKKLDSLTGGPASCAAWAVAYGAGGPCESCTHHGKIKNPAVQLGGITDVAPPGAVALLAPESVPDWVSELNARFALVRHGSKMVIVDMQTPSMTGRGVVLALGYLDVMAFRQLMNGRFAPVQKSGVKQRALAEAWLAHPARRQFAGLVFAPGEKLPADILNLWQGFAVEPLVGDVAPWLKVLSALVPNEAERLYVLRWLAWKVQNPGGCPDTVLIFKGAKGTGKNSLFDPLILLFGRHAMLADDPELIAGRFTWHLMSLAFAVLDEAVFVGDPKQADRVKSRVTAKTMHYEQKGMDPVQGVNRCAYVMLTNHEYVWQATTDERRAVVLEVGEALRGNLEFWERYHDWALGSGPAALLHYLQAVDLSGFNPRQIPKGEALRLQVELTALREPVAAWWHQCLSEGAIRWRDVTDRVFHLNTDGVTEIDSVSLRLSFEQSTAVRGRTNIGNSWPAAAKRHKGWLGSAGPQKIRPRTNGGREWRDVLPELSVLRVAFTEATQIQIF